MATVWLAGADWAARYQTSRLDAADAARARRNPQLHERPDWQCSRALKLEAAEPAVSLSHSQGAAAVLTGMDAAAGVDIECCRVRDFDALAEWIMSGDERIWWAACADRMAGFYVLWTLKEALIKAAGLDFPADMRRVGLCRREGSWAVSGGGADWCARAVGVGGAMVCCVWQPPAPAPQWRAVGAWAKWPLAEWLNIGG